MIVHRHAARSLKDGSLHQLTIPVWGRSVQFDHDPPIATAEALHSGWIAVDGRGVRWALGVTDVAGSFLLVADDGRPAVLIAGGAGGAGFGALWPLEAGGVDVLLIDRVLADGSACLVTVRDPNGIEIRSFVAPYSSMGFLQVRGPADVVMVHVGTTRDGLVPGVTFWYCQDDRGWTAGVVDVVPPRGGRGTVGLITPAGRFLIANTSPKWDGYINLPPTLAVSGDGRAAWVAIPSAEQESPAPDAIEWVEYRPTAPPPVDPPPPPPPEEPPPMDIPNQIDLVRRIHEQINPRSIRQAFEVTKRVAWALRDLRCGLLLKPTGENIVEWDGKFYAAGRVVFPDGHLFKVISNVGDPPAAPGDPPQNGPTWADEEIDVALIPRYVPAKNPGDVVVDPPPVDPPPPPPDLPPAILSRLEALANEVQNLKSEVGQSREVVKQNLGEIRADLKVIGTLLADSAGAPAGPKPGDPLAHGEVSIPILGTARVDLRAGPRPK